MAHLSILQWSAVGILSLALLQAAIWCFRLLEMRRGVIRQRLEGDRQFLRKLERIQSSQETPVPSRAWQGQREFRVSQKKALNASTVELVLTPADSQPIARFLPGQHLFLQHEPKDATRLLRCYSILNSPLDADSYRIAIRRIAAPQDSRNIPPGGMSSFVHDELQCGDRVQVKAPAGHFYLNTDRQDVTPLVLIGLDIGILALISIAETVRRKQPNRDLQLLYITAANESEAILLDELQALNEDATAQISVQVRRKPSEEELTKLITGLCESWSDGEYYLAGYTSDVNAVLAMLLRAGIPHFAIHSEIYKIRRGSERRRYQRRKTQMPVNAALRGDADNNHQRKLLPKVSFKSSQVQENWVPTASSLLEFAESHSIELPSDCRMGSCRTCMTRLVSGEVDYVHPPYNEPETGHCLPCIAVPRTDVELEI